MIIAQTTGAQFVAFSAVLSGVKEIKEVIKEADDERRVEKQKTILFVDEIHRFNKAQQDAFLPHVEKGTIILIGATTENPSFEVISPLLSRTKVFTLNPLTEEEIEVRDGKRRTVERRVFPGYILVQMILTEDSWYVVRNTPGVTGFVGMGNEPTPLRPEEVAQIVRRMEAEAPRVKVTYKAGQKVRIIDGPFNDFIGTVADLDMERAKVRVMVSFFGRETPVELDFLQVEKA
jgi:transcription termination/antitermination factor NusG